MPNDAEQVNRKPYVCSSVLRAAGLWAARGEDIEIQVVVLFMMKPTSRPTRYTSRVRKDKARKQRKSQAKNRATQQVS